MTKSNAALVIPLGAHERRARKRRGVGELALAAFATVALALVAMAAWQQWEMTAAPERDIAAALDWSGVPALPIGAKSVRVYRCTAYVGSQYYLAATMTRGQIEALLAATPGLRCAVRDDFSIDHNYLMSPAFDLDVDSQRKGPPPHKFFTVADDVRREAPWYDPTIARAGRRYLYAWHGRSAELDIDDWTHRLYLRVCE